MKLLAVATYFLIEVAAFAGLVWWLGFGWAVLAMLAALAIAVLMLRRTAGDVLRRLNAALEGGEAPGPVLLDTALLASSVVLLAVPGVVSTVLGMALLTRPGRALARPAAAYVGAKRIARFVDGSVFATAFTAGGAGPVVEGSVVTPHRSDGPRPGYRELPPAI
ncbi:FxsA family protein [Tsukamurella sp. 8F]|uniref:FxsA family protein n=1 Tax=unclassified Tsukamurella TaxID=2633480 RepID=UPI0023B93079|nr:MULTISPECIES: FxsA family protein [unclassified Tsukamurella]MDF0530590.1 FxsA family protein [Tsukamurella sp. 8J]MDF0586760.1 FxsA family protein [Tsukamurella sp. 8F]